LDQRGLLDVAWAVATAPPSFGLSLRVKALARAKPVLAATWAKLPDQWRIGAFERVARRFTAEPEWNLTALFTTPEGTDWFLTVGRDLVRELPRSTPRHARDEGPSNLVIAFAGADWLIARKAAARADALGARVVVRMGMPHSLYDDPAFVLGLIAPARASTRGRND
jgi:hypothetical protein